jgi:predicted HAD superfamily Cof-like phosphohydrolase
MSKEKQTKLEVAGDTMLDLGKLTYAGLVLAGIFASNIDKIVLITVGLVFCFALIFIGIYLKTKK